MTETKLLEAAPAEVEETVVVMPELIEEEEFHSYDAMQRRSHELQAAGVHGVKRIQVYKLLYPRKESKDESKSQTIQGDYTETPYPSSAEGA